MLTQFFLRRPRLAQVIALVILISGFLCLPLIPTLEYPQVTPPQIEIKAFYMGATADQVERAVATPIELEMNGIESMLYMNSRSSNDGSMTLTVTFEAGTNPDIAAMNVQNRLERAKPNLPKEVLEFGITTMKKLSTQLMFISLYSSNPEHDDTWMSNFVSLKVKESLARIPGVGFVDIIGKRDYSMRVWMDADKMSNLGLTPSDIYQVIKDQNREIIAGKVGQSPSKNHQQLEYVIEVNGLLSRPEEYASIPLKKGKDGKVLRLGDVATIEQGSQSYDFIKRLGTGSAIHLSIFQQPDSNGLEVSRLLKEEMERLSASFPKDVDYLIPYDMSRFVKETIHELEVALILTILLVILVIYLFLADWRSTLVPAVTIPVSLVGSLSILYMLGYTINTVTLFGLVLAVGIVVDDAIVVVENVQRQMQENQLSSREAVIQAMKEVTGPIIATTLVLFAVFFPIGFIPGTAGHFYKEFGIATASAVLISCVCALTLSPIMCDRLLRNQGARENRIYHGVLHRGFEKLSQGYLFLARWLLKKPVVTLLIFIVISLSSVWLLKITPRAFVPIDDRGFFYALIQLPDSHSLNRSDRLVQQVIDLTEDIEGIENTVSVSGFSPVTMTSSPSAAFVVFLLKPWGERDTAETSLQGIMAEVGQRIGDIDSANIMLVPPSPIPAISLFGGFDFKLQDLGGHSPAELSTVLNEVIQGIDSKPEINGGFSMYRANEPRVILEIDREKLNNLDIKIANLQDVLQGHLGAMYVDHYFRYGRNFMILLQSEQEDRATPEDILELKIRSEKGKMIPLKNLVTLRNGLGPTLLEHYNIYRTASISGQPAPGYAIEDAMSAMEELATQLPEGYDYVWSGMSLQQREAGKWTALILLLAILFAYLFLVAQFESWTLPIAVMASIPISMAGALLGLYFSGLDNNIYAQLGLILLIGLAAKNAILIIEFARAREAQGESIFDASLTAARLRFRAVLMTGLSFIMGVMPLLFTHGAGMQARKSLGTPVFWGMLAVVILATLLTPAFYLILRNTKRWFQTR
ncbi:efflux RND transporter permease subunit [Endozoicomonas arenosclerae]|uniref:efflux RND transporter permease subunit n=1 Tax=Endozoicomonas arenosclerae TaxID=1633495 RepID=UPI00078369EC|nr:efflux RND transporter permease subunit [Endozoicomonas arenosclerae]